MLNPTALRRTRLILLRWPLWQCGFRPFFLALAACAVLYLPAWLLVLAGWLPAPTFPGGVLAWHAHELLLGYGLAAVIGFSLTAVPEFTGAPAFRRGTVAALFALWLAARLAALLVEWIGAWPLALAQIALSLRMIITITPPIWRDPSRRQRGLWGALAALLLAAVLCSLDLARPGLLFAHPLVGLHLVLHLMMLLTVLTLARISMRVVNRHLEEAGLAPDYLARPPRRQIAALLIALHAAAGWAGMQGAAGWLALGAGAACLGLLSDWPHGRVLLRRWVTLLYLLPWLLGLGYLLDGLTRLGLPLPPSAGIHLLAVGALGLAVFSVLCIAGRTHAGLNLDEGPWLPWAAGALIAATVLRSLAGVAGLPLQPLWWSAGLLWSLGYGAWLLRHGAALWRRRCDGGYGCSGVTAGPH